ncbi:MAG: hypothetical protein ACJAVV_000629 [Alphaproteobacteria bacterium]|jgi:hypothetical protein
MNKIISILVLTLLASYSSAQTQLDGGIRSLSSLLNYQDSQLVPKTIRKLKDENKNKKLFLVTFSVERYN